MRSTILVLGLLLVAAIKSKASPLYDCRTDVGTGGAPSIMLFDGVTHNEIRQYFIPKLSGVDFVELFVADGALFNGRGATLYLEIRDASQDLFLGVSQPVLLQDKFFTYAKFEFPRTIPLSPKTVYAFAPHVAELTRDPINSELVQSDPWGAQLVSGFGQGAAGMSIDGVLQSGDSLLFREGMTVPEPSVHHLQFLGATTLTLLVQMRHRSNPRSRGDAH